MAFPTAAKAKKILADGTVRGHRLTAKQKHLFGMIAGGKTPRRTKRAKRVKARARRGR